MLKIIKTLCALLALGMLITPALGGCGAEDEGGNCFFDTNANGEVFEVCGDGSERIDNGDADGFREAAQAQCNTCIVPPGSPPGTPHTCTDMPTPPQAPQSCSSQSQWAGYLGALEKWADTHCTTEADCPSGVYSACVLYPQIAQITDGGNPCRCLSYSQCVYQCEDQDTPRRVKNCKDNCGPSYCKPV